MIQPEDLKKGFAFLDKYAVQERMFAPDRKPENGRFTVLNVWETEEGGEVEVLFALADNASPHDPELPALGQQCVDAMLKAVPGLRGEKVTFRFIR